MANFGVRFFTRGYDKTHREMSSIEGKAGAMRTGFMRLGAVGGGVGPQISRGFAVLRGAVSGAMGVLRPFLRLTMMITKALAAAGAAVAAVGVALATKFTFGLMKTAEGFYLVETALKGVLKSEAAVRRLSEWAMEYAAAYPAMYEDVMEAMKGMAMMPELKPMFLKESTKEMEKIMNIVQALATIDPAQGIRGALLAIREALAGQWRTLMYRFEIRPEAVAAAAGLSVEELKRSASAAIDALYAFTNLNVGAETLRESAESLGIQWGNLADKYKIWLKIVSEYGAYRKLVELLMDVNEWWGKIMESKGAEEFGKTVARLYMGAVQWLRKLMTEGVDWDEAGVLANLKQIFENVKQAFRDLWTEVAELTRTGFELVMLYVADILIWIASSVLLPIGGRLAGALFDGFKEYMRANPITTFILAMMVGGAAGGKWGALGAGAASAVWLAYKQVQDWVKTAPPLGEGVIAIKIDLEREQLKARLTGELKRLWEELEARLPPIMVKGPPKEGKPPPSPEVPPEVDKERIEALKRMKRDLTDRIKSMTLEEYEYKKWALGEETALLSEKYGKDKEIADLIAQYEKAKMGEIEAAYDEHLRKMQEKNAEAFEAWKERRNAFYRDWLEKHGSTMLGLVAGLDEISSRWKSAFQTMKELTVSTAQAMEGAFSTFFFDVMQGKLKSLWDYVEMFLRSVQMAIAQLLAQQMVSGAAGWFTPTPAPVTFAAHSGGMLGMSSFPTRSVPASVFAGARRVHGGLRSGEIPFIGEEGELVLSRADVQTIREAPLEAPNVEINLVNQSSQRLDARQQGTPRWDAGRWVIDVAIEDLRRGGPLRDMIRSTM